MQSFDTGPERSNEQLEPIHKVPTTSVFTSPLFAAWWTRDGRSEA